MTVAKFILSELHFQLHSDWYTSNMTKKFHFLLYAVCSYPGGKIKNCIAIITLTIIICYSLYPSSVLRYPCVNAWLISFTTSNTPADYPCQNISSIWFSDHQGASRISFVMIENISFPNSIALMFFTQPNQA